jgi:hypothetical protein
MMFEAMASVEKTALTFFAVHLKNTFTSLAFQWKYSYLRRCQICATVLAHYNYLLAAS